MTMRGTNRPGAAPLPLKAPPVRRADTYPPRVQWLMWLVDNFGIGAMDSDRPAMEFGDWLERVGSYEREFTPRIRTRRQAQRDDTAAERRREQWRAYYRRNADVRRRQARERKRRAKVGNR